MQHDFTEYVARVQRARDILDGKWKIQILCAMRVEPVRLSMLKRLVPKASKKSLRASLRSLELTKLVVRRDMSHTVLHVEYDFAADLREPICALLDHLAAWDGSMEQMELKS